MSEHTHFEPAGKHWPIVGSIALFFVALGVINWLHQNTVGPWLLLIGGLILSYMIWGWFADVIQENRTHFLDDKLTHNSFRWGVFWFIFTELMLFAAFFGALFYARTFSVPWLGGEGSGVMTHLLLWPDFKDFWPVFHTPDASQFVGPHAVPDPWGIPALNTLALIAGDIAVTWAYWASLNNHKRQLVAGQLFGVAFGIIFILLQIHEYGAAYTQLGLKLDSGIYANTFFMLTGVHGTHVIMGVIMLIVLIFRTFKGHFSPKHNFAIAVASWYWHFIDFLWILMFVFVYWI